MKARFYIALLIVCALVDDFISLYIPADFRYQAVSIVPHFCACAMLVIVCSRSWLDRVLIGALCGILTDYFFTISFPTYFIVYAILGYVSGLLYEYYMEDDSRIEALVLWCISFFVDFLPFGFSKITGQLSVSLKLWFIHSEIVTLIANAVIICLMIYVVHVFERYEMIQSVRKKHVEKKKFRNLKLTRK